jgi:prevent-host-death family protein
MVRRVSATHAKTHLLALLDEVASGDELEITRHGRTVARLVPAAGPAALKGIFAGIAVTANPNDDLLSTGAVWDLPDSE